jgi:hypothetical protein
VVRPPNRQVVRGIQGSAAGALQGGAQLPGPGRGRARQVGAPSALRCRLLRQEFKRRGAAEVLGFDISGEMVAVAQRLEQSDPPGVRYEVGDVSELRPLEQHFDVATAVRLLNYAQDIATFDRTCRNVHRSLKPGGEFFVLNESPELNCCCSTPAGAGRGCVRRRRSAGASCVGRQAPAAFRNRRTSFTTPQTMSPPQRKRTRNACHRDIFPCREYELPWLPR